MGCAQTGTGKTGAFALPLLQRLSERNKPPRAKGVSALILTPTRELALQISQSFQIYGRYLKIKHAVVFGGSSYKVQIRSLARGVDVLVATPGRLLDLIEQGYVRLDEVSIFVLDEADRMLDMGFLPNIRQFLQMMPADRQSMLFSATLPNEIARLAKQFLNDPVTVSVTPQSSTAEKIDQRVLFVDRENKSDLLESVLQDPDIQRVLIFTRTRHGANKIAEKLKKIRIKAEAIHSNKSQAARLDALKKFRSGNARVLVATDIASRGLDVDGITHVINYELPNEPESYVHRIGRTARAGKEGKAISFCDAGERGFLRNIERAIKQNVAVVDDHPFHSITVANQKVRNASGDKKSFGKRYSGKPSSTQDARRPSRRPKGKFNGSAMSFKNKKPRRATKTARQG